MSSNTKRIIDLLQPFCPGWERSTGTHNLLQLVQDALDQLFAFDAAGMHYRGTDNEGFPPYLTTVAGTEEYEITAANLTDVTTLTRTFGGVAYTVRAKTILRVFVDVTQQGVSFTNRWLGKPYNFHNENPFSNSRTRLWVSDVSCQKYPAYENTAARIMFNEDPGASTEKYFVDFTWEPMRLTAETIPLPIMPEFEQAIHDYVIGTVQKFANGQQNEHLARFYVGSNDFGASWIDRFRDAMDRTADTVTTNETPPRVC